jgi:UDP-4-amino-4,6-dideoxy-N-acetyl-beta-L-altrosamine transaminase
MEKFIPYGRQWIDDSDIQAVSKALKGDFLTTGSLVGEFEQALCDYCGAKYVVAVANGTAALHLASMVLLQKGDRVLTTVNSFLATSNTVLYVGATPVFVDICEDGNIDLDLCEEYIREDETITAIYGVAFSGNPLNQEKLKRLRDKYDIKILEDTAHAIGSKYDGIKSGSCTNSDCSIFSFHPVKHMTTAEGGAVCTNDENIYKKLLSLRSHGVIKTANMKPWEYEMQSLGFNYRITDIQCALGISQLKRLDEFIKTRKELAKRYDIAFENSIIKPLYKYDGNSSYHLYVVKVNFEKLHTTKEELFIKMRESNIGLQLHYMPINKQPYYLSLGYGDEAIPIMDEYYQQAFSLPMYPLLSEDEQDYVISKLFELLY